MPRPQIGDIVELDIKGAYAYAIYTHKHKECGALLRVWNRLHPHRPEDWDCVLSEPISFSCFFPLGAALNRGLASIAGRVKVPESLASFPLFRMGAVNPSTRKVPIWWLWNGDQEWQIGELTKEQRKLPILGIWNDTLLKERIEEGWTPETDVT